MDMLGYDKKTLERIYFYLEDEGLIKTFTLGGKFTITQKGTEQQADPKH
jgi:predicted transcriptional regulator